MTDDHLDDENCNYDTDGESTLNDSELDEAAATPRRSNRQNKSMLHFFILNLGRDY